MNLNGKAHETTPHAPALAWARRVLSAADLHKSLNGHRELILAPDTVVTPLAGDELHSRGIFLRREPACKPSAEALTWGCGQDRTYAMVQSAVQSLAREGLAVRDFPAAGSDLPCRWARAVAECVARGECAGGVLFCEDPGLASCVANKVGGLRAASVATIAQAARATLSLAANLLVVEMPGRTFFEIRQILRLLSSCAGVCPDGAATTLRELDGHAHR